MQNMSGDQLAELSFVFNTIYNDAVTQQSVSSQDIIDCLMKATGIEDVKDILDFGSCCWRWVCNSLRSGNKSPHNSDHGKKVNMCIREAHCGPGWRSLDGIRVRRLYQEQAIMKDKNLISSAIWSVSFIVSFILKSGWFYIVSGILFIINFYLLYCLVSDYWKESRQYKLVWKRFWLDFSEFSFGLIYYILVF